MARWCQAVNATGPGGESDGFAARTPAARETLTWGVATDSGDQVLVWQPAQWCRRLSRLLSARGVAAAGGTLRAGIGETGRDLAGRGRVPVRDQHACAPGNEPPRQAAPIPEPPVTRTTRPLRSSDIRSATMAGRAGQAGLELALEHLARRAERHLGAEHVLTRLLVAAKLGAGQLAQFGLKRRGVHGATGYDDRDRGLAPFRVRPAHHGHRVD